MIADATDTGMLATFASRLLYHLQASSGSAPLPTIIEEPMGHNTVSPHQLQQTEMKMLRTENENLRLKLNQLSQILQASQQALLSMRIGLAAAALQHGGELTIDRAHIADIQADPSQYELAEENDPAKPVLVIRAKKREVPPDGGAAGEPPAPSKLIIASR